MKANRAAAIKISLHVFHARLPGVRADRAEFSATTWTSSAVRFMGVYGFAQPVADGSSLPTVMSPCFAAKRLAIARFGHANLGVDVLDVTKTAERFCDWATSAVVGASATGVSVQARARLQRPGLSNAEIGLRPLPLQTQHSAPNATPVAARASAFVRTARLSLSVRFGDPLALGVLELFCAPQLDKGLNVR